MKRAVARLVLGWSFLVLAGCTSSPLRLLVVDGHELHPSLVTRKLEDITTLDRTPVLRANPYLSTSSELVELIARGASQGRLGGEGMRAAVYGVYLGESELGFYGLEAASSADADRREAALREIWAYGERLGRARVHRIGRVLVIVWQRGGAASCWEAVNARIVERLSAP